MSKHTAFGRNSLFVFALILSGILFHTILTACNSEFTIWKHAIFGGEYKATKRINLETGESTDLSDSSLFLKLDTSRKLVILENDTVRTELLGLESEKEDKNGFSVLFSSNYQGLVRWIRIESAEQGFQPNEIITSDIFQGVYNPKADTVKTYWKMVYE